VDFYSGIILSAIGFPTEMFTVLFALARTVGWTAQWNEMISDPGQRIGRPRQLYTGPTQRDYVDRQQALISAITPRTKAEEEPSPAFCFGDLKEGRCEGLALALPLLSALCHGFVVK
jgi:hypothetical protein